MSHGLPDWGMTIKSDIYSLVDDLAELPPRLGFPSSIDRRGCVLLMETFDTGAGLCLPLTGALGETYGLSSLFARYGRFSYKLTRIANVNSYAAIYVRMGALVTDKIGVEVHFADTTHYPNLILYLQLQTLEALYTWGLRWDTINEKAYIGTQTGGWTEVDGTYFYTRYDSITHVMKLVADSEDFTYSRGLLDGNVLIFPEVDPVISTVTLSPYVACQFHNGYGPAYICSVYVDAIILTRGEQ